MPITTPSSAISIYNDDKDHFKHVLECLFIPAVEQAGFDAIPPSAKGSDVIHGEIIKSIETADLVLCDMSYLNPNVFFELGVRTAIDKPTCLIKDDLTPTTPFDTTIIHHHTYLGGLFPWTLKREIDDLCQHIQETANRSSGRNSLWKFFGLTTRAELVKPKDGVEDRLALLSTQVESLSAQLSRSTVVDDRKFETERKVVQQSRHELLYDHLTKIASPKGVVVEGMGTGGNIANLNVRQGTLTKESEKLLKEAAKSLGYTLNIIEGHLRKDK